MTLQAGTHLGPYEILSPLGAGGMGEVYKGRDTRLERPVAIKVLPPQLAEEAEAFARFQHEARAVAALNHPNILGIFDIGTAGSIAFVVMELLEGQTFRDLVNAGPMSPRRVLELSVQVAQGLAAAHEQGIIHRDLKPENLFLTHDGRVKILDFGLAKRLFTSPSGAPGATTPLSPMTTPGLIMGTLGYMSPEQVRGHDLDGRSDLFAFGVVLYELLTGKRPFERGSTADTLSAILKDDIPEQSFTSTGINPVLDRIVRHCLEKSPQRRFQNARDLAFALENAHGSTPTARGLPALTDPPPAAEASGRPAWMAPAALGALLLLPLAFAFGRRSAPKPVVQFTQLASGSGEIQGARFTRDGRAVIFSAAFTPGAPPELHSARTDGAESRSLGVRGWVQSVSEEGDVLLLLPGPGGAKTGTLAKVPLAGGEPKELATDIVSADWAPKGAGTALVRQRDGLSLVEFPAGTPVHRSSEGIYEVRVAPEGKRVAFSHFDANNTYAISVVDGRGRRETWARTATAVEHLAWAPGGDAIYFTGRVPSGAQALFSADRKGRVRTLHAASYVETVLDASADGKLLTANLVSSGEAYLETGAEAPQPLVVGEQPRLPKLALNGRLTALTSSVGTGAPVVYFRHEGHAGFTRLGPGILRNLTRDGAWGLVRLNTTPFTFQLQPLGAGDPLSLPLEVAREKAAWIRTSPSGARVVGAIDTAWVVWEREGAQTRTLKVEGVPWPDLFSPDEKTLLALHDTASGEAEPMLVDLATGRIRPIPLSPKAAPVRPIAWAAPDLVYVWRAHGPGKGAEILRLDPWTGALEPHRAIPSPAPGFQFAALDLSPDGRTLAYAGTRIFRSRLNLIAGLAP